MVASSQEPAEGGRAELKREGDSAEVGGNPSAF